MTKPFTPAPNDPEFDRWWEAYPRKVSKGDARKAWFQTKALHPQIMDMLKALAVQKASDEWRQDEGKWIPYPATYLRNERWSDVPEIDLGDVKDGQVWWLTVSGVQAKAAELKIEWDASKETFQSFAERVKTEARALRAVAA